MPSKVASQHNSFNGKGRGAGMTQSSSSNTSQNDGWESGAEAPASKMQKSPSNTSLNTERKPFLPFSRGGNQDSLPKSNFTSRRRQSSIPNAKAPAGPRPLDIPAGKRSISHSIVPNSKFNSAATTHTTHSQQFSINNVSRFSFASIIPQDPPRAEESDSDPLDFGDFLAPVNFDDFHDSITTDEPNLSHFPLPGRGANALSNFVEENRTLPQPSSSVRKTSAASSIGRKNSAARQQNSSTDMPSKSSSESMTTSVSNPVLRSRRQSHFPPNSFNNPNANAKTPRKSIGPGTFVEPDPSENKAPKRRPSVGVRKSSNEEKLMGGLAVQVLGRGGDSSGGEDSGFYQNARTIKAKSTQGPRWNPEKDLLTPSRTPDPSRLSSGNMGRSAGRTKSRSGTPGRAGSPNSGTANRRMSVMPNVATGLGARTISPTDARRMRRMSIAPQAPPMPQSYHPQAPPTPQPEPSLIRTGSNNRSPGPGPRPRKSTTPSSSRTTPDLNRKSYSSGQSLSSSTSYNSVQSNGSVPPLPNGGSTSRLPTPKPLLEPLNISGGEDVPPVPAIPKAFESPQSEMEQPFFSARSSGLSGLHSMDNPVSASPHMTTFAEAIKAIEAARPTSSSSRKSSLTFQTDSEPRQRTQTKPQKRNVQPLRLPPLNLLPLSTPTAAKIKALEDMTFDSSSRPRTPPDRKQSTKTPSTPMTASKATFFSKSQHEQDEIYAQFVRSSTSHHALRAPSSSSINAPFSFDSETPGPRIISPFTSSSLPKNSGEFSRYMQPKYSGELSRVVSQARPSGPRAPSFSIAAQKLEEVATSPTETESPFSASALRRKLSRKRSEPAPSEAPEKDPEEMARYDNMPPPKLPASATWSNLANAASSPTRRSSYLSTRRKASGSSTVIPPAGDRHGSIDSTKSQSIEGRPSIESNRSFGSFNNRSSSRINSTHSIPMGRPAPRNVPDTSLDRDDMAAEEEMKRLASKRKDFESAARELDGLRRRACPQNRVSSAYALQSANLNLFERGEIVDFQDVYFTGTRKANKIVGDLANSAANFGYDDERGDYNIVEGDHLAYRYEVIDLLGKGSFGQVVRCIDHKTGILVAVKIIRNKKRFHQQALVEVNILQKLREWDPDCKHSVVNFDQSFYFRGHLCISTDLLGMNLYEFIKAHDFKGFSLKLIRRFTKQLLASLVLLHGKKVIHCDLKPENVLLAHPIHSEIKVIDFGSSCFENEKVYTYIQSRFYRSPEVILGMSYGMPIDMWSLGCILAELFTGYPIFPGENEQEQLACIMEVFGPPEKHLIEKSSRKKLFFDSLGKPRLSVSSKGRRRRPSSKDLRQALKCDDEAFLDFITRCLRWDPARRMDPHEALRHEFISGIKPMNIRKPPTVTATNSPIKRVNSVTTPGSTRPLPVPPATSFKNGTAVRTGGPSPMKATSRRQSNITALQMGTSTSTAKRASHAAMTSSAGSSTSTLPRMGMPQRVTSNRPDSLATAAAAASLVR